MCYIPAMKTLPKLSVWKDAPRTTYHGRVLGPSARWGIHEVPGLFLMRSADNQMGLGESYDWKLWFDATVEDSLLSCYQALERIEIQLIDLGGGDAYTHLNRERQRVLDDIEYLRSRLPSDQAYRAYLQLSNSRFQTRREALQALAAWLTMHS